MSGSFSKRLNMLFIAGYDSTNAVLAHYAACAFDRGHAVTIATRDVQDAVNNRPFVNVGLVVTPLADVDDAFLDDVDVAMGSPIKPKAYDDLYARLRARNVLLFSFACLFSSVTMRILPDFVFASGQSVIDDFHAAGLEYPFVKLGNPAYDRLVRARHGRTANGDIESVIVVEQGGYPYGSAGKLQLADALVRIARDNPDIRFDVKPRYLPGQKLGTLHSVSGHLFDCLDNAPENLRLLVGPEMVEDIVADYDAMIALWSTAHLAAVALDMPLLLLDGFDSLDVFDVRTQRVRQAYAQLSRTGCVHHHEEVRGDVRRFFHVAPEEYARCELFSYDAPCADETLSFMEATFDALGSSGLRARGNFALAPEDYYARFAELDLVDASVPEQRALVQRAWEANACVQDCVHLNRNMAGALDLGPVLRLGRELATCRCDAGNGHAPVIEDEISRELARAEEGLFSGESASSRMEDDAILQDYYLGWLYETGQVEEIERTSPEWLLCPESLEYYLARIALDRGDFAAAHAHLCSFLRIAHTREAAQTEKCRWPGASLQPFKTPPFLAFASARLATSEGRDLVRLALSDRPRSPLQSIARFMR